MTPRYEHGFENQVNQPVRQPIRSLTTATDIPKIIGKNVLYTDYDTLMKLCTTFSQTAEGSSLLDHVKANTNKVFLSVKSFEKYQKSKYAHLLLGHIECIPFTFSFYQSYKPNFRASMTDEDNYHLSYMLDVYGVRRFTVIATKENWFKDERLEYVLI